MLERLEGSIVVSSLNNTEIAFFVSNPSDEIQRFHFRGEFYEQQELDIISSVLTSTTRVLDVGANVGNHVIYLAVKHGLSGIVAIEPNPVASTILKVNIKLNQLADVVDLSRLDCALSDKCFSCGLRIPSNNLGGTRLSGEGSVRVVTGDSLFSSQDFDFIKIDVEGMEMECLRGLAVLINRCSPAIFIEVHRNNQDRFFDWCSAGGYRIKDRYKRYAANENFLVVPEK